MDEREMKNEPEREAPRPNSRPLDALLNNPWVVIAVLFLATGALGIPLIWVSRAFSWPVKILLTLLVTAYTCLLLWATWLILVWCLGPYFA